MHDTIAYRQLRIKLIGFAKFNCTGQRHKCGINKRLILPSLQVLLFKVDTGSKQCI
jgi:hypothetical protein